MKFNHIFLLSIFLLIILTGCHHTPEPVATPAPTATATATAAPSVAVELQFASADRVEFRFSEPVKPLGTTPSLEILPPLSGVEIWQEQYAVLVFEPAHGFDPREYAISINPELFTANQLAPATTTIWNLQFSVSEKQSVSKASQENLPRVISHSPLAMQLTSRTPEFRLTFNQDMNPESVRQALQIEPEFQYKTLWEGKNLIIQPQVALPLNETYEISLAQTAENQAGVAMWRDYTWTYLTKPVVDRIKSPTTVDRDPAIAIYFNYTMDTAQVSEAIQLSPAASGAFSWNDSHRILTFTPVKPLAPDTKYILEFVGTICDRDGNPFPQPERIYFKTPSVIVAADPQGNRSVNPGSAVGITFDRPMDPVTTEAAFSITPTLTGTLTWEANTLSFFPQDGYLAPETSYEFGIDETATDAAGQRVFQKPFRQQFTTGEFQKVASFGEYGANAQVLDAAGRRAVQFFLGTKQKTRLKFELYQLPLAEFVKNYASQIRIENTWSGEFEFDTSSLVLAKSWQAEFNESGFGYGNAQEVLVPAEVPPGIYVMTMGDKFVHDQLILILSHNTLVVKRSGDEVVAWLTDINGASLSGLEVSVFAENGARLAQGRTDEKGIYRTQIQNDVQPGLVVARQWQDYTVSGLNSTWQAHGWYWGWGMWSAGSAPVPQEHTAYVYTDRPIYKPGQTVYFKAMVRQDADAELRTPTADTAVDVKIRDARDNIVQTLTLQTNYYGTVNGSFPLAEGAMLGNYAVEVGLGEERFRQVFKVQDYRKPDITINVDTEADRYLFGETVTVTVDTAYLFGEPVANARLTIQQYTLGSPYNWYSSSAADQDPLWYESGLNEKSGLTDENGRYTFSLPAAMKHNYEDFYTYYYDWGSSLQRTRWGLEVSVNDGSNQEVSGFTVFEVFNAQEKIKLDTQGYFKSPQQSFTVAGTVLDLLDQPVANREVTLHVSHWDTTQREYRQVIELPPLTSDRAGEIDAELTLAEPGYYEIKAQSQDAQGNLVQYLAHVSVYAENSAWESRYRGDFLAITTDQDTYLPGETAQLMIESAFSGPALLTLERGSTRQIQEIFLEAPVTSLAVPIRADFAPNIFATVSAWVAQDTTLQEGTYENQPDSRLQTTSVELIVPVTDKTLQIQINPDRERYTPRDTATFQIQVTDQNGEPVRAELSLALVDEGIFSLSEDLSGSIFETFYGRRSKKVTTFNSMALARELWLAERGGGGGDEGGPLANPRSNFPDTAIWLPEVRTNAAGEAFVEVALPDTLTTWRLTAKAISAYHEVGETSVQLTTQQPVIVQPRLPRTLTVGDQVMLSAFVHNYTAEAHRMTVSLRAEGLALPESLTQTVRLQPGEVRLVAWPAQAIAAGAAFITIRVALPDGQGDAVQESVPIHPRVIPQVSSWVGDFEAALDLSIPWPTEVHPSSNVIIELNRSIAGSLLTGLEQLTGYPYGCVEQTMSKALPNAVVGRAFNRLNMSGMATPADLAPQINAGLQRLYGYQHDDGGWGWWYDDDTEAYQTAWVIFGLATTAEAGYEIDPAVLDRGNLWLAEHLDEMSADTRAYALYSMAVAGQGVLTDTLTLATEVTDLDAFSQFALALALHELGAQATAEQLVERLVATAVVQNGKAYWSGADQDGVYNRKTMASDIRTTALGLSALVKIQPGHPLEGAVVRWLMNQRTTTGWGTTNETSYAILGLTDHLDAHQQTAANTTYQIVLNGMEIESGSLNQSNPVISLEIPAQQFQPGENQLQITQTSNRPLYYLVRSQIDTEQEKMEAVGNFDISRVYLDPRTNKPLQGIQAGDLIKVKLSVSVPASASYVIVEDKIPGGLEALNSELNTSSHASCADRDAYYNPCKPHFYWQSFGYNYKEIRADRVSFFITEMAKGTYTFTYFARATQAGEFTALPAEAWAMYDVTLWGRSASEQVSVTSRE